MFCDIANSYFMVFIGSYAEFPVKSTDFQISNDGFAVSFWSNPDPGCNGYLLTKTSTSSVQMVLYSIKMTADTEGEPVSVSLSLRNSETKV